VTSPAPSLDLKTMQYLEQRTDLMVKALQTSTFSPLRLHKARTVSQTSVCVTAHYNPEMFNFMSEAIVKVIKSRCVNHLT
jgi:hypothetical protein